ncbi:MAG: 4Fe-4S dicluster domain-containing protein [Acidobacteriota bacterium]
MSNYIIIQDADKCGHCEVCVAKCMKSNHFPARVRMTDMVSPHHTKVGTHHFAFLSCHHCETPLCVAACPHGAMQRTETGVVRVTDEFCHGCASCAHACPWHVPRVLGDTPTVKCNLCDGKAALGETPECVATCPRGALRLVRVQQLSREGREEYAQKFMLRNFLKGQNTEG